MLQSKLIKHVMLSYLISFYFHWFTFLTNNFKQGKNTGQVSLRRGLQYPYLLCNRMSKVNFIHCTPQSCFWSLKRCCFSLDQMTFRMGLEKLLKNFKMLYSVFKTWCLIRTLTPSLSKFILSTQGKGYESQNGRNGSQQPWTAFLFFLSFISMIYSHRRIIKNNYENFIIIFKGVAT